MMRVCWVLRKRLQRGVELATAAKTTEQGSASKVMEILPIAIYDLITNLLMQIQLSQEEGLSQVENEQPISEMETPTSRCFLAHVEGGGTRLLRKEMWPTLLVTEPTRNIVCDNGNASQDSLSIGEIKELKLSGWGARDVADVEGCALNREATEEEEG